MPALVRYAACSVFGDDVQYQKPCTLRAFFDKSPYVPNKADWLAGVVGFEPLNG
jgi:hypothetical protein